MRARLKASTGAGMTAADHSVVPRIFAIAAWLTLAYVAIVTLGPISWRPDFGHMNIERFGGFAALSFLFAMGYPRARLLTVTVVCVGAVGLELLQLVVPGRDASLFNVLIKIGGCAVGVGVGTALSWLLTHRLVTRE